MPYSTLAEIRGRNLCFQDMMPQKTTIAPKVAKKSQHNRVHHPYSAIKDVNQSPSNPLQCQEVESSRHTDK